MAETLVPEALFQRLLSAGSTELPPVCAILGGIVGQVLPCHGKKNIAVPFLAKERSRISCCCESVV